MSSEKGEKKFWTIAESLYSDPSVKEGTMMGFKCLRVNKAFFATLDHRSADLVVKLSKERVGTLIEEKIGLPFSPAGRVFKEWVAIPYEHNRRWTKLMLEAKEFVALLPTKRK
ncbi:hypothetical protein MLD52_02435 [Puniceicoccaceae bacterium K14]|nr:hypothetical protein [Puniceicoccaceae bacterium K14]